MRKMKMPAAVSLLIIVVLMLTACGRSEFGVTDNTEKRMFITASRADKGAFFLVGTLEVDDGEKIVFTSELTKGSVRVEIVAESDSGDVLDGEAILSADLGPQDSVSGTVPAGSYLLRATCLEKATGTIEIKVQQE